MDDAHFKSCCFKRRVVARAEVILPLGQLHNTAKQYSQSLKLANLRKTFCSVWQCSDAMHQGFVRVRSFGGSGSGFRIYGVPFEQILFQISDLSNPLRTRIHRITDLSDLQTDHQINDPARSFG